MSNVFLRFPSPSPPDLLYALLFLLPPRPLGPSPPLCSLRPHPSLIPSSHCLRPPSLFFHALFSDQNRSGDSKDEGNIEGTRAIEAAIAEQVAKGITFILDNAYVT